MKAAILVESLTGNTWKAAEKIGSELQQAGWSIVGFDPVRKPNHGAIQEADILLVGTWVHGLFVVGQSPWGIDNLRALPSMVGKDVAAFCTFALNPGRSLDVLTRELGALGGNVVGGLALHRARLGDHTEEFAARLVDSLASR